MHNLSNAVWVKKVYDGVPTSDTTSDGAFSTAINVAAECPRILFLVHGVKTGDTSNSVMVWQAAAQTTFAAAASAADSDYADITGATHGVITLATSDTEMGPYILDLNAAKAVAYGTGSVRLQLYTSDATTMQVHVVALGYGGDISRQNSDIVVSV